jgi:hypothetical protein
VERQQVAVRVARVRLLEDAVAVRQLDRVGVAEAAHPGERPEVLVEAPVLLHQEHDVLDVVNAALTRLGRVRRGEGLADVRGQEDGGSGGGADTRRAPE